MDVKTVLVALTVMGLVLFRAPCADGQDKDDTVVKRFDEASELAESGRLGEAVRLWTAIADKLPAEYRSRVQLKLGYAHKKFGKLPEASYHLTLYLKSTDKPEEEAVAAAEQVEKSLCRKHRKVVISSMPEGASVCFHSGADALGYPCPLTWWFKPGKHKVHLKKQDHEGRDEELTVVAGEGEQAFSIKLAALEKVGTIEVKGPEVGAEVYVDGNRKGTVPLKLELHAGTHDLVVSRAGRPSWKRHVTVRAGDSIVERPVLPRFRAGDGGGDSGKGGKGAGSIRMLSGEPRSLKWKLGWGFAGGGAGLVVLGGVLQIAAYSRNESLYDEHPPGSAGESEYVDGYENSVKPMATAAYVFYGLGGAAAAAGIVLLVLDKTGRKKSGIIKHVAWAPLPVRGGGGAVMGFEF